MDGFQSKPINMDKLLRIIRSTTLDRSAEGVARVSTSSDVRDGVKVDGVAQALDLAAFHSRRAELVDVLGEEDFEELLTSFFDDAHAVLAELGASMESGDRTAIDRLLHTIKGAAGNVGLQPVGRLAQSLRDVTFDEGALRDLSVTVDDCARCVAA